MKKYLCFLLIAALLLSVCPAAFAEASPPFELPVLPDGLPEDNRPPIPVSETASGLLLSDDAVYDDGYGTYSEGRLRISVTMGGSYFKGVTWIASVSRGSGNYSYSFKVVLPEVEDGNTVYYCYASQEGSSNSFSYTFTDNGAYQLWVDVSDLDGGFWERKVMDLPVYDGYDPVKITMTVSGQDFVQPTVWTVNATGGSGDFEYYIALITTDLDLDMATVTYSKGFSQNNTLRYQFVASGSYALQVWVRDRTTGKQTYGSLPYTARSAAYPTVTEKVNALVAQCRAEGVSGDYETALWLHDWLIYNACYDLSYSIYGPDGVLLGGTGVCDSYSKAYLLLLKAAGIPVMRVTGGNHSWNAVQIQGEWYFVDATWDDPTPNGYENHIYFCIPEEILILDHDIESERPQCISYAYNYFAQSGVGTQWAAALSAAAQSALENGSVTFSFDFPASYTIEGYSYSDRTKPGAALADRVSLMLAGRLPYHYGSQPITLNLFKIFNSDSFACACVDTSGSTLTLPVGLKEIEADAFCDVGAAMSVEIPYGVTSIGSGAFTGCDGLWSVTIPPSVTSFGDHCFDRANPHLTLCAAEGSAAEAYAKQNGFRYLLMTYVEPNA